MPYGKEMSGTNTDLSYLFGGDKAAYLKYFSVYYSLQRPEHLVMT